MRLGQVSVVLRHAGAFGNKLVRGRETRVGMAFVARGLIPAGLRSRPLFLIRNGAASRPSGDKSPRHRVCSVLEEFDHAACGVGGDFDQPAVAVQLQAIMPTEL